MAADAPHTIESAMARSPSARPNLHGPASMDALSKARSVAHVITQPRGVSDGDKANSPRSACYVIRSRWPPTILFISSGHPLASAAFELMDPALQGGGANS